MENVVGIVGELAVSVGMDPAEIQITLRKPLEFQSNRLYDIWAGERHFIAKEYLNPDELESASRREYAALQALATLDIAPQPIFFEPSLGPIVVYEYMQGEMWDRRSPDSDDLEKLVAVWLQINAVPLDWPGRGRSVQVFALEAKRKLEAYHDWTRAFFLPGERTAAMCLQVLESRQEVIRMLSEQVPVYCFCREDPRFANIIQRPDSRLGMVDWEDSGMRDPARELADIVTHPNQEDLLDWDDWQVFVEPFLDFHRKRDAQISDRMHLYLMLFPLFWLTQILQRGMKLASAGGLSDWGINGIPGNERLRRYLARALAWPEMGFGDTLDGLGEANFFPSVSDKIGL